MSVFDWLDVFNNFLWDYVGFVLLVSFGAYMTFKTKFAQFRVLANAKTHIKEALKKTEDDHGVHPLKLYFASVGGTIGLGNIVGVTMGLALGGPGAVFWLWVASFSGMLVKYSEIFLGVKHRQKTHHDYNGGPMYFLYEAFHSKIPSVVVAFLLCIYGTEVFQFTQITNVVASTYGISKTLTLLVMLALVFYSTLGGVKRVSNVCTILMPFFMLSYIIICLIIIALNFHQIPALFVTIMKSAFTGHAAVGGFAGASLLMTISQGMQRAVYSGDIGIGYDAVMQAATRVKEVKTQARLSIFSLFADTFICFLSMSIVLCSGLWMDGSIDPADLVTRTLMGYFPYAEYLMAIVLFLAGFTTVIAYLSIGYKAARFLSDRFGPVLFTIFSFGSFVLFGTCFNVQFASTYMTFVGGLLMLINISGIIKMRREIDFR